MNPNNFSENFHLNEAGEPSNFFRELNSKLAEAREYFSEQIATNLNNVENRALATRLRYIIDQFADIAFSEASLKSGHLSPEESTHFFEELNFFKTASEDIARANPSRLSIDGYKEILDRYAQFAEDVEQIASKEAHFQASEGE